MQLYRKKGTFQQIFTYRNLNVTGEFVFSNQLALKFEDMTLSLLSTDDILNSALIDQLQTTWSQFAAYFPETIYKIDAYKREPQPAAALLLDLYHMNVGIVTFLSNMSKISNLRAEASKLERTFGSKLLPRAEFSRRNSVSETPPEVTPPLKDWNQLGWQNNLPNDKCEALLKGKAPGTFITTWNNEERGYIITISVERNTCQRISALVHANGQVKLLDGCSFSSILDLVKNLQESRVLTHPLSS